MKYAVIVIDIGMTNKKVAVYSDTLEQLAAEYKSFDPLYVDSSLMKKIPVHNLEAMESWFKVEIKKFSSLYPVKAISVTTHGATTVCVDGNGNVCAPCIYYTYEPGDEFQTSFYNKCGSRNELQRTTFSPAFSAMINPAKGIYFLQRYFAADFAKTKYILNFPQYWGFVLTGKSAFEPTYMGSHTLLWDHQRQSWSSVVDALGIQNLLPARYAETYDVLGSVKPQLAEQLGLSPQTVVTLGVHDSNASLLPYLAKEKNDFVLNSTGTWCVSMHPEKSYCFNEDDIGKIVYFNQSVLHTPVKTAIFLGGMEFDTYRKMYERCTGDEKIPVPTMEDAQKIISQKNIFLLPEVVEGSGQFTSSKPGIYVGTKFYPLDEVESYIKSSVKDTSTAKDFFALLDISLVIQTVTALRRSGLRDGTAVFTEGGFRKNALYNELLASVMPRNEFYLTDISEATAFGSAMTAVMALEKKSCDLLSDNVKIEKNRVAGCRCDDFADYLQKWILLAQ